MSILQMPVVRDAAKKQREAHGAATAWTMKPTPFEDFGLPAFPVEALPDWLRQYVVAAVHDHEMLRDLSAMLCAERGGGRRAKKVEVVVKDGYQEPVNLYVAVALPPGSRKSAVLDKVTEPIRSHEAAEV